MFDFPASPTVGATYISGGKTYTWDGEKWRNQVTPIAPAKTAQTRNHVINPSMQIAQEIAKNTNTTTSSSYIADQWQVNFSTTGAPGFACMSSGSGDDEVCDYIQLSNSTADTSLATSEMYRLLTVIEASMITDFNWGAANAKPAVLRFRARSSIVGTFSVNLREMTSTCTFIKHCTFAAANTWQTFTIPVPPCTIGTWNTGVAGGLVIQFLIASGSTTYGTDGAWVTSNPYTAGPITNWLSATSQTFRVSNIGLYLDPDATGVAPPFEVPNYADELRRCQRYWQQAYLMFSGYTTASGAGHGTLNYPVIPRTTPTLSAVSYGQSNFPSAAGTCVNMYNLGMYEYRISTAAGMAFFQTLLTANARM